MRSQPNQIRLIIANLYIRVRIARENADTMRLLHGMGSSIAERAKGAELEAKNALMLAIMSTKAADRPGPQLLLEIARRSAETRRQCARRQCARRTARAA